MATIPGSTLSRVAASTGLWIGALMTVLSGCASREVPPNHRQGVTSPSGRYILTVPVKTRSLPQPTPVWIMTIADRDGHVLYEDRDSQFIGTLNVYWVWDNDDRVWLYNTDDGRVFMWDHTDARWSKREYGGPSSGAIGPPLSLFPPGVKPR